MGFSTFTDVNSVCIVIKPSARLDFGFGFQKSWLYTYRR